MREKTRVWCFPPCPPYDVEGTESWLSDMASEGWMLGKDSFFLGVASFIKKEPASVRYRLEAAPKRVSDWDSNGGTPDAEAIELNTDFGWEYIARRSQFYIYRNISESNREINTDPQVQALAIQSLQKRQLNNLGMILFSWILYPLLFLWVKDPPVLIAAEAGLFVVMLSIIISLWIAIDRVMEIVHLQTLKRKLQAGIPFEHRKGWKNVKITFYGKSLLKVLLIAVWMILSCQMWNDNIMQTNKQECSVYQGDLPFATIDDFAEGTYEEMYQDLHFDYALQWKNAVLNTGIKWSEHARIYRPDGSVLQGGLYVTYYDAKTEWLAKSLASAYHRSDRIQAKKNYVPLECPDFGLDDAVAYCNEMSFPCIIFRQGNIVVHAYFYQTGQEQTIPLEKWAAIMADSIK